MFLIHYKIHIIKIQYKAVNMLNLFSAYDKIFNNEFEMILKIFVEPTEIIKGIIGVGNDADFITAYNEYNLINVVIGGNQYN